MRSSCRFCVGSAALSMFIGFLAAVPARAAGYGTVTGQFVLDGSIPVLKPVVSQGDASARDAAVCAKDNVPNESLVVDPVTKGIANVFVFMAKAPADIHPDLKSSKEKEVKFDQKGCRFKPHAMILRTDQTVVVLSDDPISHNTHVNTTRQDPKNDTIVANDREGRSRWNFSVPEKYVTKVNCDIHGWMTAWWLIADHPYAVVSDKQGKFTIDKVPAGEQTFMVWQEQSGWVFGSAIEKRSIKVNVKPNETTDLGVLKVPVSAFEK